MQRVFRALIAVTILTTSFLWLIVLRGLVTPTETWSLFGLRGSGTGGDFWIVSLLFLFNGIMLALAWRGAPPPFHLMLLLWHGFLWIVSASWLIERTTTPSEFVMTWEPTTWTATPLAFLASASLASLGLAAIWALVDLRRGRPRPTGLRLFPARFSGSVVVLFLMLPLAILLMRSGSASSLPGRLGAFVVILQWWLFNTTVLQRRRSYVRHEARENLPEFETAGH